MPDPETGGKRLAWALVVVLAHSRHQYIHVTFLQKLGDLLAALEDAWQWFGGVPRRVVLDYVPGQLVERLLPSALCGR